VDIWLIGSKNYELERIRAELDSLRKNYRVFGWADLRLPLKDYPKCVMVLSLEVMRSQDELIYGLCILEELTRAGTKVIPPLSAIYDSDKFSNYLLWARHLQNAIQMPDTCCSIDLAVNLEFLSRSKKVIFKPISGSKGEGIEIVETEKRLKELLDDYHVLYLQEVIPDRGYDLRTLMLGDRIIAQYARYNPTYFLKNIHQGAVPKSVPELESIDPSIKGFAKRSQKIVKDIQQVTGLELMGVDTLPSKDGRLYLLEWNSIPGFQGAEKVTKSNIAWEIVQFFFKG
jgi:glutathione synthase/RimK-type ligase-like ATP-grasp enzyme